MTIIVVGLKGKKMPTINIKDMTESKIVKLVDLSEDSINKIAEAVVQKIAEPVRHGHWIKNDNGTYSCSLCQSWIPDEQHYYAKNCLYCGAKMDEATDGKIHINAKENSMFVGDKIYKESPTVDIVEVVRCKDCRTFYDGECDKLGYTRHVNPNDFCSWGERREDGNK